MLGPETPTTLTAQFTNLPTEHDGSSTFEVWVGFSHDLRNSYTHLHEHPTVTGGKLESTSRFDGRSDLWKFLIEPDGDGTGRGGHLRPWPAARLTATSSAGDGIMAEDEGTVAEPRIAQRQDRRTAEARLQAEKRPGSPRTPSAVLTPPVGGSFLCP